MILEEAVKKLRSKYAEHESPETGIFVVLEILLDGTGMIYVDDTRDEERFHNILEEFSDISELEVILNE